MKLKVGDIVEFKKYEDLSTDETTYVSEDAFPKYGKVSAIVEGILNGSWLSIENSRYVFNTESVARVIDLKPGDEVLIKATVKEAFNGFIQINSSIDKTDVVNVLKHNDPEHFIVKEHEYGLYIGTSGDLVIDKDRAQTYTSREDADNKAADMYMSRWDVIPYDD